MKIKAELNWQTNSRMDERLNVASLEDDEYKESGEKTFGNEKNTKKKL